MGDQLNEIIAMLGKLSGGIGSLLVIFGFIATVFKPIRKKIGEAIIKLARTPLLIERLDNIDKNIAGITDDLTAVKTKLEIHATENSIDIKNANRAQMMSVRCQIRDIYVYNLPKKTLSIREQRDIHDLYDAYLALGGNSYIHTMVEEMKEWQVHEGL